MQLDNVTVEAIEEMHSRQLGSLHKQCHAWRDNGIVYKDAKRVHDSVAVKLIEYGINHKSTLEPQGNVPDRGLYLVPPHGKLIADGRKTAIVNKARLNLAGRWVLVSGKQAFGVIAVGEPESTHPAAFAERFQEHRVREKEREKWWPDRQTLYLYEIKEFEPFKGGPLAVQVPPGVHFKMGNVKLDGVAAITAPQEPQQKPQQKMRTDNILEQLSDLPEKFVWVPDFVSITGSTIYAKGREPNDVDVILRAEKSGDQFELRLPVDAGFALKLERVLKDALKVESVQYTGNQYGPNWKSLPLYHLCLVKVPKLEYRELDEAEFAKQQYKELKGGAGDNQLASPKKTQVPKSEVKRRQSEKAIQVKPDRIEPALSTDALNRLLRGTNASTRRQAKASSDEDLDAILTRPKRRASQKTRRDDENGTVEYPPMESDDLTTADKSRPSRTRCMECDKSPVVDVHWADGRGRAWFCLKCFKGWLTTEEGDREVVRAWFLPDGTVPKKMGDDSSVQIRKLGEGLGSSKIVARLEKLLSAAKSAEATSDGKVKVQKDDVAVAASVLLADKALKDYPDENVKLCYVAQSHSRDKSSHLDLRFEYKRGSANYLRGWTVTHQPDPGEPIPAGATREFPGVFDIVAKGECSWGAQKPFFNEWFLDGNWKGRWTFRLVQREGEKFYLIETGEECKALMEQLQITAEDLKSLPMLTKQDVLSPAEEEPQTRKGAYWILLQPLDQRPYVLGKEAVSKGWLPPKTVSCLPKEVRASVPKNLQYWMMDGENALEARRELAGETELKGGSGSGWFGPPEDAKAINVLSDDDLAELHILAQDAGAVEAIKAIEDELTEREKGGSGSGHRGHAGIPGYQGGSLPGSGGTWAHHGGERQPVEYTASASHARRKMLQVDRQYGKKIDRAREQWEEASEVWMESINEKAALEVKWWDAALADDIEQERKLKAQVDRATAKMESSGDTATKYHETYWNLMTSQTEEARAQLLKVENPATFDVNFGRLRGGKKEVQEGAEVFSSLVGTGALDGKTVKVKRPTYYGKHRAYYEDDAIHMPTRTGPRTTVHELGHWLEDNDPKVHRQALAFLKGRTKGETAKRLSTITGNKSYKRHEVSRPDKFISPYMGKDYGTDASEIISMGLEYMAYEPVKLAQQDPEYFDFMYDLMRGR